MLASSSRVFWVSVILLVLVVGSLSASSAIAQSPCVPRPLPSEAKPSDKIDPVLLQRLQTAASDEALPIAVWLYHDLPAAQQRYWDVLAAKHPEVDSARRQQRGLPFLVDDPALSDVIRREYESLLSAELDTLVAPLVQDLGSVGVKARGFDMLPSVEALLTPAQIQEVAKQADVQMIFLVEAQGEPALDTATATDRVPRVWANGYDGVGQIIAVVEPDNVTSHTSLNLSGSYRTGVGDVIFPNHADEVAMAAASRDSTYPGVARGATILNAGMLAATMPAMYDSINWALSNSAHVVNISSNWAHTPSIQWIDVAVDYAVRSRRAVIVTVAGNYSAETVTSPGKGYNVLTVGGSYDNNTPSLADDTMYSGSAYINPIPSYREKPEVVAPGQQISFPENLPTEDGTSFAAPQVAGLAAVLIKHSILANPTHSLRMQPLAIKAITMASAVQNIEGDSRLSDQDGAGGVNAILADEIARNGVNDGATCFGPCWWSIPTTFTNPGEGGYRTETFTAVQGERIRVVATWFSDVPAPPT